MKGFCVWFTGLPGSGKTARAEALVEALHQKGLAPVLLDGDEVRTWLTPELGFSEADRRTNVMRVAGVAKLVVDSGGVAIVALVSPYWEHRDEATDLIGKLETILVYLYGRVGENLWEGTVYQEPDAGESGAVISIDTKLEGIQESAKTILEILERTKFLAPRHSDAPSLFLGRWQPFHDGHRALIQKVLAEGKKVVIGIRDTELSEKDPYTTVQREMQIQKAFPQEIASGRVTDAIVPDFSEICIGRTAGYGIRVIHLDQETESISGTKIRESQI